MSQEEATETLIKASRQPLPVSDLDTQYMTELVEELGCLALALVQAGVYIFNMGIKQSNDSHSSVFQQYLSLFRKGRAELMRKDETATLDQYKRGVYSTLDLSYGLLTPSAQEFLALCSQFHFSNISLSMILAAVNRRFEDGKAYSKRPESQAQIQRRLKALLCPDNLWSELHIREIIQSLSSFSLVQITLASDMILLRFHPLVHSWANQMLSVEDASVYHKMATTVISTSIEAMHPAHLQYALQHIVKTLETIPLSELHPTDKIVFGDFMATNGMGGRGIDLLENAVKELKDELGSNHLGTADATVVLCNAYLECGRMNEAEKILVDTLEVQRSLRGEEHLETMKVSLMLLDSRLYQGRQVECLEPLISLEKKFQEKLGEDNKETLLASDLLGCAYNELGRYEEAEDILRRTLRIQTETIGKNHPDTLDTFNHLAMTRCYRGDLKECEIMFTKLLETRLEIRGEKHHDVIESYNNLANVYQRLGNMKKAEEIQIKVVDSLREMMGWRHPDTLTASSNLALIYSELERNDEAAELQTKQLLQSNAPGC
jgi:tetratricopeptide (TPR) repeat protein